MSKTLAQRLFEIAKSVEPAGGFAGIYGLADALEADPAALARFKSVLARVKAEELDGIAEIDPNYGHQVMAAADAMDLLPDDPRLFLSERDANALPDAKVLGALCSACIVNDVATVALLAPRVDVNSLDHNKQTPLCYAAGNNHPDCVRILLQHGANPNRVQNWGNTAMHVAASSTCSKELFAVLLDAGGDVNARNDEGESVLDVLKRLKRQGWVKR